MAKKLSGLGKGFDALLPADFDKTILAAEGEKIQKLSISSIVADPHQPRRTFDATELEGLAASIKRYGILQPLVVSPAKAGSHQIIAGERRFRAASLAGLTQVPAIVRSVKDHERVEIALIENVQRVQLAPLEQAASIETLHGQFNLAYEEIAERLGKAPSTITNIVRLLQLPAEAAAALREAKLSEGHARAILALRKFPKQQLELLKKILEQGWSVRQSERFVTGVKAGHTDEKAATARVVTQTPATKALGKRLGTTVSVKRMAKGGRLEISFTTDAELERIIGQL